MFPIPLPLPTLEYDNDTDDDDDTGFTLNEKRALKYAWDMINSRASLHAREESLRFLLENEETIDKFRNGRGQINISTLHEHPFWIFNLLETLIFEGSGSFAQMHGIINTIAVVHQRKKVTREDMKKKCDNLKKYFMEVLQKFMSPTLEKAIGKLFAVIVMAHQ